VHRSAKHLVEAATLNRHQQGPLAIIAIAMQTAWEKQGKQTQMDTVGRILRMLLIGGGGQVPSRLLNHHSKESRSAAQALRNMLVHGTVVRNTADTYSAGVRTSEQRVCYRARLADHAVLCLPASNRHCRHPPIETNAVIRPRGHPCRSSFRAPRWHRSEHC